MPDTPDKKKRSPNYTHQEKSLLLEIAADFGQIIENKQTDSKTWKEKDTAWDRVSKIFNFRSKENIRRNKESLRKLYDNLKKARKRRQTKCKGQNFPEEVKVEVDNEESKEMVLRFINRPTYDDQHSGNSYSSAEQNFVSESPSSSRCWDDDELDNLEHGYYTQEGNEVEQGEQEDHNTYRRSNIPQRRKLAQEYAEIARARMSLYKQERENLEKRIVMEKELHELQKRKLLLEIRKTELEIKNLEVS